MNIIITKKLLERFWCKVDKQDFHWIWIGGHIGDGYGCFVVQGKVMLAHRVSYLLTHKHIPAGQEVLHKNECHNRSCVNPEHLYLGTHKNNVEDIAKLGDHPNAKLTKENVLKILELGRQKLPHREIATHFNVRREQISRILRGVDWKHLQK